MIYTWQDKTNKITACLSLSEYYVWLLVNNTTAYNTVGIKKCNTHMSSSLILNIPLQLLKLNSYYLHILVFKHWPWSYTVEAFKHWPRSYTVETPEHASSTFCAFQTKSSSLTLRREAQFYYTVGKLGSFWPHDYYGVFH